MLHELHERAVAANQRRMDEFLRNKQERMTMLKRHCVSELKRDLMYAADEGIMIRGHDFNYNNVINMTGIRNPSDLIDIMGEMFEMWFTEEPDWRMPILFDNPHTCLSSGLSNHAITVWFDFREPTDQCVLK
jgi:hypothetical protein